MTWLSKLTLNVRNRQAQRDLGNSYDLHRTLMRAFPGDDSGGSGAVRFRLEPIAERPETPTAIVLVQSENPPNWEALPDDYLIEPAEFKEMSQLEFVVGQRLRFRLRANPTKRLRESSVGPDGLPIERKWVGKRVGLRREDEQIEWLHRKGIDGGFRLIECVAINESRDVSWKRRQPVTQVAVRFEGVLEITDAKAFAHTLDHGVGSAKGFGFGLLSVGRA